MRGKANVDLVCILFGISLSCLVETPNELIKKGLAHGLNLRPECESLEIIGELIVFKKSAEEFML